jgi:hypothetical protein
LHGSVLGGWMEGAGAPWWSVCQNAILENISLVDVNQRVREHVAVMVQLLITLIIAVAMEQDSKLALIIH